MSDNHPTISRRNRQTAGMAGEYLVCFDLLAMGIIAHRVDGLPYDVVANYQDRVLKIQVKTTITYRVDPRSDRTVPSYLWYVRRCGRGAKELYAPGDFDVLALVAMDIRRVAYFPPSKTTFSIFIRQPGNTAGQKSGQKLKTRHFDDHPFSSVIPMKHDRVNPVPLSKAVENKVLARKQNLLFDTEL